MSMLKHLVVTAVLTLAAYGQGAMEVNNRLPTETPITFADGSGPGSLMVAGVYLVRNGALELLAKPPLRTGHPQVTKYFWTPTIIIPGIPAGAPATFRVCVWPAAFATFEAAVEAGACCGEFPTVTGNGEAHIDALGDVNPGGGAPITIPFLPGLLPLELPCVLASGSTSNLFPVVKLNSRQMADAFRLEVLTGFVDQPTLVQASTNLVSWFNIANSVSTNRFVIEEPLPSQQAARWYRAIVPD